MGFKADFNSFHGDTIEGAYIGNAQNKGGKPEISITFDVYPSEASYRENPKQASLESLSVRVEYDYVSNIYELAYNKLKEDGADRFSNIIDV